MSKFVKFFSVSAMIVGGLIFVSCSEHDREKAANEAEQVKQDVKVEVDSIQRAKEEWEAYKANINAKIAENKVKIQEIKDKMAGDGRPMDKLRQGRIDALQKKINDLQAKLDNWNSDYSKWEEFKADVDKSVEDMEKSVKDFLDNK